MKNFSGVCQAAGADKPLRAFFIWITNIVTLTVNHSSFLLQRKTMNAVWMMEMTIERHANTRVCSQGKWNSKEANTQTTMLATRKVNIPLSSFFWPIESFITQISIKRNPLKMKCDYLRLQGRSDQYYRWYIDNAVKQDTPPETEIDSSVGNDATVDHRNHNCCKSKREHLPV